MSSCISGEQFVRTLRHYLEANANRLLIATTPHLPTVEEQDTGLLKTVSSLWQPTRNNENEKPSSLYGIPIPYMSLLGATSPNATSLSNTPYMPPRSSLTLDVHYLYFLLVQFDYLGLEQINIPTPKEHGLVETETTETQGKAPSISSVGSVMSTLSLSTGWQFWSNKSHDKRPLHEDIVYIHRYLSKVTALKLNMNITTEKGITKSGQRTIQGYETPLPQDGSIALPLNCFKQLAYLELNHISPRCISNLQDLSSSLVSLVVKSGNVDNMMDVIGNTEWKELKMLSLADNSLTTLDHEPAALLKSLTHLNLSSNLLIDIPSPLASLYNLTSLNLSFNMVSFVTGINTVLGNIQELDLRGNRLTVLAGLDRLWALERLDVRDNRIDDLTEIGRLTSLPNIADIWVEGNPFTKLKLDYRVDVFNLFKKNGQEIELDGTKPSYGERRHIHGNNFEKTGPSTPSASVIEEPASVPKWPTAIHQEEEGGGENGEEAVAAAVIPKAKKLARAKTKGNKRIIRLGQVENKNEPPIHSTEDESTKYMHRLAELEEAVQEERVIARRAASVRSRRSKKEKNEKCNTIIEESTSDSTKRSSSSDAFRKRIEAMRKEAGTEWLRVLQEMDVVKKQNSPSTTTTATTTK